MTSQEEKCQLRVIEALEGRPGGYPAKQLHEEAERLAAEKFDDLTFQNVLLRVRQVGWVASYVNPFNDVEMFTLTLLGKIIKLGI